MSGDPGILTAVMAITDKLTDVSGDVGATRERVNHLDQVAATKDDLGKVERQVEDLSDKIDANAEEFRKQLGERDERLNEAVGRMEATADRFEEMHGEEAKREQATARRHDLNKIATPIVIGALLAGAGFVIRYFFFS